MAERASGDESEFDEFVEGDLPYGMCGVTGLLERLRSGTDTGWEPRKREMVARYLLDLSGRYWLSNVELDFCRRFLMAA